jgi:hypothetical protein
MQIAYKILAIEHLFFVAFGQSYNFVDNSILEIPSPFGGGKEVNVFLLTHEAPPILGVGMALAVYGLRPIRGVASCWRGHIGD